LCRRIVQANRPRKRRRLQRDPTVGGDVLLDLDSAIDGNGNTVGGEVGSPGKGDRPGRGIVEHDGEIGRIGVAAAGLKSHGVAGGSIRNRNGIEGGRDHGQGAGTAPCDICGIRSSPGVRGIQRQRIAGAARHDPDTLRSGVQVDVQRHAVLGEHRQQTPVFQHFQMQSPRLGTTNDLRPQAPPPRDRAEESKSRKHDRILFEESGGSHPLSGDGGEHVVARFKRLPRRRRHQRVKGPSPTDRRAKATGDRRSARRPRAADNHLPPIFGNVRS